MSLSEIRNVKTFDNSGFAAFLALTTVATAMGIDGTLPLMPSIAIYFQTDKETVQLSLSLFMLGVALGQLIHGPLSDRFGRKPAILGGLFLTSVSTIGCALSNSIELLIFFRFLHGITASSGWLIARAVIRDRHDRDGAARVLSLMLVFHGLAPLLSPIIGAHLCLAFGWQAMFWFLALYSFLVALVVSLAFTETIKHKILNALDPLPMLRNFSEIFRTGSFWSYTGCAAGAYGVLFAFLSDSSHVIITTFGESEAAYSYMFAGCMLGSLIGMILSAKLTVHFGADRVLRWGVCNAIVFSGLLAILAWLAVHHWLAVIAPMFMMMIAFALIFPSSIAGVLQPFPQIAGSASSLVGFVQQIIGALTGIAVTALSDGTQHALANGVLFWSFFAFLVYWAGVRKFRTI